jgi:hypothetical protein
MLKERKLDWWERYSLEGKAKMLRRLLERRFGALPAWVDQKLATAPEKTLLRWGQEIPGTNLSLEQFLRT